MKPAAGWIVLASVALSGCCGTCCQKCMPWSSAKRDPGEPSVAGQGAPLRSVKQPDRLGVANPRRSDSSTGLRAVDYTQPEAMPASTDRDAEIPASGSPSARMTVPPPPMDADQALPSVSQITGSSKQTDPEQEWNTADSDLLPAGAATTRRTIGVTDTLPKSAYAPQAD